MVGSYRYCAGQNSFVGEQGTIVAEDLFAPRILHSITLFSGGRTVRVEWFHVGTLAAYALICTPHDSAYASNASFPLTILSASADFCKYIYPNRDA